MELVKSLLWIPFGLILAGGVVFIIIVLLKVVLPSRKKTDESEDQVTDT